MVYGDGGYITETREIILRIPECRLCAFICVLILTVPREAWCFERSGYSIRGYIDKSDLRNPAQTGQRWTTYVVLSREATFLLPSLTTMYSTPASWMAT